MALKRQKMRVFLATEPENTGHVEHVVELTFADQLRGELEAKKNGIPDSAALHVTAVWCWCALTRTGLYDQPFQQFLNVDCLDIEREDDGENVDPTQPAAPVGSA